MSKLVLICLLVISFLLTAQTIFVQNDEQLKSAVNSASPGDTIVVRSGQFDTDGSVTIRNNGTIDAPIVIKAENLNGTELINESYFDFRKCSYIELNGFIFSSQDVTAVKLQASHHIRITNNIFRIQETESVKWVLIGGIWDDPNALSHDNKIDHNIFENKTYPGNFITIDGSPDPVYQSSQRDTIEYNYFRNNDPRAENEKESIRIGWSELSPSSGYTVVQYNLFEDCNGDPEIISVKTCDNIIRYNTFRRSKGTLCLRHGDRTVVNGNFFFGEEVAGTGGIRVYGDDHIIYNNFFTGLAGSVWDAPITLTNGDYDGGSNYSKHFRINRAIIVFNTLVNNTNGIEIGYTNNGKYSKPPRDVVFANNIVCGSENDLVKIITSPVNMEWNSNIFFAEGTAGIGVNYQSGEIIEIDPELEGSGNLWRLGEGSPAIDSATGDYEYVSGDIDCQMRNNLNDIGADEYSSDAVTNKPLTSDDVGPVDETTVSVKSKNHLPYRFTVKNNYPNPFNGVTNISFSISAQMPVKVVIHDFIGREIEVISEKVYEKGEHSVRWTPRNVSSGVYFYTVHAGGKLITNKIIYLK
ncbi:MAG: lyase [Melioribacteraceae bacterium]|nr:MAG: lyase [Melioribacteraceae bacterium]